MLKASMVVFLLSSLFSSPFPFSPCMMVILTHFTVHKELWHTLTSFNDKYHISADNDIIKGKKESKVIWNHLWCAVLALAFYFSPKYFISKTFYLQKSWKKSTMYCHNILPLYIQQLFRFLSFDLHILSHKLLMGEAFQSKLQISWSFNLS